MSRTSLSETFNEAVSYLSNTSAASQVSNATKLELYGLFKFLTVSQIPNTSRPSVFDLTGRAKWDAWKNTNQRFADNGPEEAQKRYIDIARSLGWKEGAALVSDPDSNDATEGQSRGAGGGSGGMGAVVSTLAAQPENDRDDRDTIHAVAISGDVSKLTVLLKNSPEIDVNERDEYGYTPLHLGCDRGNIEIVKLLLKKNADKSIKDPDDFTALELARIVGHDEIEELLTNDK